MIAICPNPYRDIDLAITRRCMEILTENGIESTVCPVFAEAGSSAVPGDISCTDIQTVAGDLSLAIVIGGDGTILSVVGSLYGKNIPVLGVNLGTMGFMASIEAEDLNLILNAARGEYPAVRRMMLDVFLTRKGRESYLGTVLNDAVIHGYGDTIVLNADCSGNSITSFSGDGIILSTPTGSTGYSMSAGGPIVEPDTECIIISPICAHAICSRSFVLSGEKTVSVSAEKLHDRKAYVSLDGNHECDFLPGDVLTVRRSEHSVSIIDPGIRSFYDTVFEKLTK